MYKLYYTSAFEKDLKRAVKRGYDIQLLEKAIDTLETTGRLEPKYLTHKLKGIYADCLECHIRPDWLLIWSQNNRLKEIIIMRTGTHTDLF